MPTQKKLLSVTTVRANPVHSETDTFPSSASAAADNTKEVSCIWDQEGILERYKEFIGDGDLEEYRRGEYQIAGERR